MKLADLASRLMRLSGHLPEKIIPLRADGSRPGEKNDKELVGEFQRSMPSSVDKVLGIQSEKSFSPPFVTQIPDNTVFQSLTETPVPKARLYNRKRRVVILGCGQLASEVYHALVARRPRSMEVVGFIDQKSTTVGHQIRNSQIIGSYDNLWEVIEKFQVKKIVVCVEDRRSVLPVQALLDCKTVGIEVVDGHQIYEAELGRLSIDQLRPSALIFSAGFKRRFLTMGLKRAVDVAMSAIGLVVLMPLCLLIGLLIKIDSPGPVLYKQTRVGLCRKPYPIWKFRSMHNDAEKSGPRWADKEDPRVSRVGRILRKLRIDELPQLYNVLRGEMSLVGPRPERPEFVKELRIKIPYYDIRHTVRPGITGWAQIRFRYGSSAEDSHTKLQYDLYYVKNMSLGLDVQILTETIRVVLFGEGAR
jgi:sugar transferase (PEP-CTERM system associated)